MVVIVLVARILVGISMLVLTLYAIRHYWFALTRMRMRRPKDTMELVGFVMPSITVLVPMHNEERVASDILQALIDNDYDPKKLEIIPINDRSNDRTAEIIDEFAAKYPFIKPFHRKDGQGGKPAALVEVTDRVQGDIILMFDADYVPGRSMLKMLVAPFADPEIGAVMGRVVPYNVGDSLLSGLLSLERAAGYQSGQQSRFNLGFTAQFGGTVGGVRKRALDAVGGWNPSSLTEDTDLTFALLLNGWRTAYVNRAECYEEVPQDWPVRRKQLMRWVMGHTACLHDYWPDIMRARFLTRREKIESFFLLGMYWTAPWLVIGWIASLALFFIIEAHYVPILFIAMTLIGYQMFANQATFLEIGSATLLDGNRKRILLMPLNMLNFFASIGAICHALWNFYWARLWGTGDGGWDKTRRTRLRPDGGGSSNAFGLGTPRDSTLASTVLATPRQDVRGYGD